MRRWGIGRGWLGLACLGLIASALAAGWASAGQAAFPGHDGRIAFAWDPDVSVSPQSCGDIFSVKPNGSGRRRLTRGCPWLYSDPAYSAAGDRVAFVRGHEPFPRDLHGDGLYVMNADGSNLVRISTSRFDAEPAFSPSGDRIVFDRFLKRSKRTQLFLVPTGGGRPRQLTHGRGAADATFSPDGRELAFVGADSNLFTIRPDGSDLHRITRSPARFDRWYGDPDFSPDGRLLVAVCGEGEGFGSIAQVCVMRADGAQLRQLTSPRRLFAGDPGFSPDGRRIAFIAQLYCEPRSCGGGDVGIYTMETDGSHLRRVYNLGPDQEFGSLGITWQPLPQA